MDLPSWSLFLLPSILSECILMNRNMTTQNTKIVDVNMCIKDTPIGPTINFFIHLLIVYDIWFHQDDLLTRYIYVYHLSSLSQCRSCSDLYPGWDVWLVSTLYMAITGWLSWLTPHNSNHHRHTHSPATTPSAGHGHGVKTSPWFSYIYI